MKVSYRTLLASTFALLLAALVFTPQLHAQLPAPPAPVTAGDAKEFEAADALFQAGKWKEAQTAFERFVEKYKLLSPRSRDAKFRLGIAAIQTKAFEEGIKHLRDLIADKNVDPTAKEMGEDLERWLNGEAIKARRQGVITSPFASIT